MRRAPEEPAFIPKSRDIIDSGTSRGVSHLILAGILNSLIVVLSHLLYAVHAVAGFFVLSFFHQALENLFLATVYLIMILRVKAFPLTINAIVWGGLGLAMGYWPVLPVALPAGLAADLFIRKAGRHRSGVMLAGYAFYATCLAGANGWPILLLKQSATVRQTALMDPFFAGMVETATWPVFLAQLAASLVTALIGGRFGLRLIRTHFKPAGLI